MTTETDRLEELRALLASPGWQYVQQEVLDKALPHTKALRARLDEYTLGHEHGWLEALEWAYSVPDVEINRINDERTRKNAREVEEGE